MEFRFCFYVLHIPLEHLLHQEVHLIHGQPLPWVDSSQYHNLFACQMQIQMLLTTSITSSRKYQANEQSRVGAGITLAPSQLKPWGEPGTPMIHTVLWGCPECFVYDHLLSAGNDSLYITGVILSLLPDNSRNTSVPYRSRPEIICR